LKNIQIILFSLTMTVNGPKKFDGFVIIRKIRYPSHIIIFQIDYHIIGIVIWNLFKIGMSQSPQITFLAMKPKCTAKAMAFPKMAAYCMSSVFLNNKKLHR